MKLKKLQEQGATVAWPKTSNDLPVLNWDQCSSLFSLRSIFEIDFSFLAVQEAAKTRQLIVISGFIHDVTDFIERHPGGKGFLKTRLGKDATTAFYGGSVSFVSSSRTAC